MQNIVIQFPVFDKDVINRERKKCLQNTVNKCIFYNLYSTNGIIRVYFCTNNTFK